MWNLELGRWGDEVSVKPTNPTTSALMSDVALALTEQAARHVECAKAELASEARTVGRDLLPMVVGVPLLCVGYVFVCIAASSSLAVAIGPLAAGAVVGVANLVAGLIGVRFTYVQLRERRSNRLTADGDVPEAAAIHAFGT